MLLVEFNHYTFTAQPYYIHKIQYQRVKPFEAETSSFLYKDAARTAL